MQTIYRLTLIVKVKVYLKAHSNWGIICLKSFALNVLTVCSPLFCGGIWTAEQFLGFQLFD